MIDPAKVKARIAEFLKTPIERLDDGTVLTELVHESFVLVQLVIDLEEEFDVRLVSRGPSRT
jgi:acyl carrier protein